MTASPTRLRGSASGARSTTSATGSASGGRRCLAPGVWAILLAFVASCYLLPILTIRTSSTPRRPSRACCSRHALYCCWRSASTSSSATPGCSTSATSRFYAVGAYTRRPDLGARQPAVVLAALPIAHRARHAGRRPARHSDAAAARRLPRHRHAGLRRDHPHHGQQHRLARRPRGISRHPPAAVGLGPTRTFGGARREAVLLARLLTSSSARHLHAARLEHSRVGRAWVAIREDEDAAELMGVPTFKFKLWAFAIGAGDRRARRRALRGQARLHQPGQLPSPCSRSCSSPPWCSAGPATCPASSSARVVVAYLPERFRGFADIPRSRLRRRARRHDDLPPQGIFPSRRAPPSSRTRAASPGRTRPTPSAADEALGDVDLARSSSKTTRTRPAGEASRWLSAPRARRRHHAVRWPHRPRRRELHVDRARSRAHRPERRRQDHRLQRRHRRLPADRGHVAFDGKALDGDEAATQITKLGIARTFQNIRLFPEMTALENVMVGADAHHRTSVVGAMFRAAAATAARSATAASGRMELLEFMGIARRADEPPATCPTATSAGSRSPGPWPPGPSCSCLDEPAAGLQPGREGSAHGRSSAGSATGAHGPADRARHEPGDGRHRPHRRARLRRKIAEGTPAGDPREPGRDRGLPGSAGRCFLSSSDVAGLLRPIEAHQGHLVQRRRRRDRHAHRRQRRRQDHHAEGHLRPAPGRRGHGRLRRAATSPACPPTSASSSASARPPRAGASSRA